MTDPYQSPNADLLASDPSDGLKTTTKRSAGGFWYFLLIPISFLYTVGAREVAGPGYTTAPNQGAMVLFFLASLAWPIVAIVVLAAIRRLGNIRGVPATLCGLFAWVGSCAVPFLIGMQ